MGRRGEAAVLDHAKAPRSFVSSAPGLFAHALPCPPLGFRLNHPILVFSSSYRPCFVSPPSTRPFLPRAGSV